MTSTETTLQDHAAATPERPLGLVSLDQVDAAYSYGVVKVAHLGEEADEEIAVFTTDPELAVRAADHFLREHYGAIPDEIVLTDEAQPVTWRQIYNHCGCVEHQLDEDGAHLCRCKREGLPPCTDDPSDHFEWVMQTANQGDLDAVPVVLVSADFHFPVINPDDGVQAELVLSPSGELELNEPTLTI